MTAEYIREYYRQRRERIYADAPDPETHPLRIFRRENDLSYCAAGRLLGVSDSMVWAWERGLNPTPEWVFDIIQDGLTDYARKKLDSLDHQRRQAMKEHPIRQWRKRLGINQKEAAELLGCTRTALASWEQGRRETPLWAVAKQEEIKWI